MNSSEEQMNTDLIPTRKIHVASTSSQDTEDLIHNNQHSCDVCNKTFATASLLRRHQHIHNGTRYPCTLCNKTFSRTDRLKTHIREQHEGKQRDFKCDECQKVFLWKGDMMKHKQIHLGTRYPCTFCDKTFSRAGYLKKHIRGQNETQMENENRVHAIEPEDIAEEQESGHIHSFIVKIEDNSEDKDSDAEEEG